MVTPEAVPLDLETASIGSRFLALLIDIAIQGTLLFTVLFAVIWGYPIAFESLWRGRTIGKAALGLRVVTKEGGQIGFRHAAIRAALRIFTSRVATRNNPVNVSASIP